MKHCFCRQIEAEHVKETQELQQCWMELRHVVRCVYREAGTGFADNKQLEEGLKPDDDQISSTSTLPDVNKMKELVHRLAILIEIFFFNLFKSYRLNLTCLKLWDV